MVEAINLGGATKPPVELFLISVTALPSAAQIPHSTAQIHAGAR